MKSRIDMNDNMLDAMVKLAEGNPGAVTVMAQASKEVSTIDPDDILAPWGPVLSLDSHGIYGSRIWMLYNDVCGQSIRKVIGLLRVSKCKTDCPTANSSNQNQWRLYERNT